MTVLNQARFTINGDPSEDVNGDRGYDAALLEVLTLALEASPTPALSVLFEVFDPTQPGSPLASFNAPLLVFGGSGTSTQLLATPSATASLTMPASGTNSWLIRCTVSLAGGPVVFERIVSIRSIATVPTLRKTVPAESAEYKARGWSDALNEMVDALITGLAAIAGPTDTKDSARLVTTANHALSGLAAIDGVVPVAGDRILVKSQTLPSANGIYVAAAGAWSRSPDANTSALVTAGLFIWVTEGAANSDSGWLLLTNDPIVLGVTGLTFGQVPGFPAGADDEALARFDGPTGKMLQNGNLKEDDTGALRDWIYKAISPAQITADQTDYNPAGWDDAEVVLLDLDADWAIDGVQAVAANAGVPRKVIINKTADKILTIYNNSAPTLGNEVLCPMNRNALVWPREAIVLAYDYAASKWRVESVGHAHLVVAHTYDDDGPVTDVFEALRLHFIDGPDVLLGVTYDGVDQEIEITPSLRYGTAVGVGGGNAEGTPGTGVARADHGHAILETSGPDNLTVGAIPTGSLVLRTGAVLLGTPEAAYTLKDGTRAFTGTVAGVAPVGAADLATKSYVDAAAAGARDAKDAVRVASTANIAALTGLLTIDGVLLVAGDRVLVKDQAAGAANGIYVAAAGAWSRSTDANTDPLVTNGLYVWATAGTVNAKSGWLLTTADPIVLGVTVLTFVQVSGLGDITAGAGLTKTGNTLDVVAAGGGSLVVLADSIKRAALTGDVTAPDDSNATTIANDAVTNAKLANMPANTIKANNTGGAADPIDATVAQILTMLGIGAGAASSPLTWGSSGVSATTTTRYLHPWYQDSLAPTTVIQWRVPRAGTIKNLRVRHNTTAGNGLSIVYTLRKNSVATALTASLASTGADASDLVNTVTVAAGDLVDIEVTKAASVGTSPSDIMVSVEYAA